MNPISSIQPNTASKHPVAPVPPVAKTAPVSTSAETNDAASQQAEMKRESAASAQREAKATIEKALMNEKFSQETLDEISRDLESLHSVGLSFSQHEGTGRTMVKVLNRDTDEIIREIPAERVLDIATKIEEMVGILFDEKV